MFTDFKISFMDEIEAAGLCTPMEVIADGEIHRFKSSPKSKNKNGYYALHDHGDFMAGIFGCWESDVQGKWHSGKATGCELSDEHRALHEAILKQFELEQVAKKAERKEYAAELYRHADCPPLEHGYIKEKELTALGDIRYMANIRCADFFMDETKTSTLQNCLLIPVSNIDGEVQSLQAIIPNGKKFFMKGGKLDGGCFVFEASNSLIDDDSAPEPASAKNDLELDELLYSPKARGVAVSDEPVDKESPIYTCEGYATGSTLHEATGEKVIVAFNAGGLQKLVPELVELYGHENLVIAADNDHVKEAEGKGNKGLDTAKKLAEEHSLPYTAPYFENSDAGTDWNDFAKASGLEAMRHALSDNKVEPEPKFENFDATLAALNEDSQNYKAFEAAIRFIKDAEVLDAFRMRDQLNVTTGVGLGDIRAAVKKMEKKEALPALTHHQIAEKYAKHLGKTKPVGEYGVLWVYNQKRAVWESKDLKAAGVEIAMKFSHEERCQRENDYKAIASHTYNYLENPGYFADAPRGLLTPSRFYCIKDKQLASLPHNAEHRARFRIEVEPDPQGQEPVRLLNMLNEAFAGNHSEDQIRQLRMFLGMTLFGLQNREQRAVLLFGAAGSGKSLFLKIIESLVPGEYITNVSPVEMGNDYKVATLAGKLMNLVPEVDKTVTVPSDKFKSIVGGDTIQAREPYGKAFSFTPSAANWFNGNFFLTTRDHSEGFWRRWAIVHFVNTKPAGERDPDLLDNIISNELPEVLTWAMKGVMDYLENGLYLSPAHHTCLAKWKNNGNSVASWQQDSEDNNIGYRADVAGQSPLKVTHAYTIYKDWCQHNNRKPFNKQEFKEQMASLGNVNSLYQGYSCYTSLYDARTGNKLLSVVG